MRFRPAQHACLGAHNRGIGAQATPQMLLRFRQDVIALKPVVVHILAGINDLAGNVGPMDLEAIESDIASMIDLAPRERHRGRRWIRAARERLPVAAGALRRQLLGHDGQRTRDAPGARRLSEGNPGHPAPQVRPATTCGWRGRQWAGKLATAAGPQAQPIDEG
jgi:hypothetical protein